MKHNKQCIPEHLLNYFRSVMVGQKQNLEYFGDPRFWCKSNWGNFNLASMTELACIIFSYHQWCMCPPIFSVSPLSTPATAIYMSYCQENPLHTVVFFPELCISIHIQNKTFLLYSMYSQNLSFSWGMDCPKTKIACISLNVSKILHKASIHICSYTNDSWLKVIFGK